MRWRGLTAQAWATSAYMGCDLVHSRAPGRSLSESGRNSGRSTSPAATVVVLVVVVVVAVVATVAEVVVARR